MHHPQKNRSTPSKENAQYTSFYDALTHSNNIEYKINQVAQVKLHINPIYKLNSIKKLDKDSLVFHQKRGKAIYFRKKQNKQDQDQIQPFSKSSNKPISASKPVKCIPTEINPSFRQKMRKYGKHGRTNLTEEVQNRACFTGSSILLHRRQNSQLQKSREFSYSHRLQCSGVPNRQAPIELSGRSQRGKFLREAAYLTQRNRDISPWQGDEIRGVQLY